MSLSSASSRTERRDRSDFLDFLDFLFFLAMAAGIGLLVGLLVYFIAAPSVEEQVTELNTVSAVLSSGPLDGAVTFDPAKEQLSRDGITLSTANFETIKYDQKTGAFCVETQVARDWDRWMYVSDQAQLAQFGRC